MFKLLQRNADCSCPAPIAKREIESEKSVRQRTQRGSTFRNVRQPDIMPFHRLHNSFNSTVLCTVAAGSSHTCENLQLAGGRAELRSKPRRTGKCRVRFEAIKFQLRLSSLRSDLGLVLSFLSHSHDTNVRMEAQLSFLCVLWCGALARCVHTVRTYHCLGLGADLASQPGAGSRLCQWVQAHEEQAGGS